MDIVDKHARSTTKANRPVRQVWTNCHHSWGRSPTPAHVEIDRRGPAGFFLALGQSPVFNFHQAISQSTFVGQLCQDIAKISDFCSICSFQADRWLDRTEKWCLHYTQFESAQFPDHVTTLTGIFQSSDLEKKGTWKELSCTIILEELKLGLELKVCELTCFTKSNLEMPDGELNWALVCFEGEQFAAAHRFSIESQVQGMSYRVTQCRTDTFGDRFRICLLGLFSPFFFFITFFSLLGSFTYTQVLVQEKGRHYSYRVWSEKWSKLPSFQPFVLVLPCDPWTPKDHAKRVNARFAQRVTNSNFIFAVLAL